MVGTTLLLLGLFLAPCPLVQAPPTTLVCMRVAVQDIVFISNFIFELLSNSHVVCILIEMLSGPARAFAILQPDLSASPAIVERFVIYFSIS